MFLCIIGLTTTSTTSTTISKHKDFSGVWYRTKSVNLEAVIGASGAGFLLRKIAASLPITHTITMNPPILNTIRLQEKAGPVDFDNILTINSTELKETIGNGKKMLQRIYWEGDSLILQRIFPNENFEMIISRTLDDRHGSDAINDSNSSHGGNSTSSSSTSESKQLISKIVHRHLKTGNEIEATSWFKYMSPSPNNPPIPDVITMILEDNNDDDNDNNNKKKQNEEELEAVVSKNTAVTSEMNDDVAKTTTTTTTASTDGIDSSNKAVASMPLVSSLVSSTTATTTTDIKTTATTTTTTATAAAAAKNRTSTLLPLPLSSQRYTSAIISRKMVNINHDYNEDDDDLTAVVKMRSFSSSVDFSTGSVLSSSSLLLNGDDVHQKKPDFSGTWIREG